MVATLLEVSRPTTAGICSPASTRSYSLGWSSFQTRHLRKIRSSVPSRIAARRASFIASRSGALPPARRTT